MIFSDLAAQTIRFSLFISISMTFLYPILFHLQPSTCIQTQASPKSSTKTRLNLKGSRKLQNFGFTGGLTSGTATGGGIATGLGSVMTMNNTGVATATGTGEFTTTSGGSGFVNSVFGNALGNAAGGGTGTQVGTVSNMLGIGTIKFDGTTTATGTGGFGAGFSPVQFNSVTTEIPGAALPAQGRSPKNPIGGSLLPPSSPPSLQSRLAPLVASALATELSALRVRQQEQCWETPPLVLDPVVVRPRTLEAVWECRPTILVPLVDLDRELVLVPLLV
jgi:hypothetical protein